MPRIHMIDSLHSLTLQLLDTQYLESASCGSNKWILPLTQLRGLVLYLSLALPSLKDMDQATGVKNDGDIRMATIPLATYMWTR